MAAAIEAHDKEKTLYSKQIKYLDEQLERYQLKCDELEKRNKKLVSLCDMLEKDKDDISQYLKRSAAENEERVEELVEQLEKQLKAVEQERDVLKLQHRREVEELEERAEQLQSEKMEVIKLEEQKEEELMQLQSNMKDLENQPVKQKKEQETDLNSSRMNEKVQNKVNDKTSVEMSSDKEDSEHQVMLEMFKVQVNVNINLWEEKNFLYHREIGFSSTTDKLQKDLDKVKNTTVSCKKEVDEWMKKCRQIKMRVKDKSSRHKRITVEEEVIRQRLASADEEVQQEMAKIDQLGVEVQQEKRRRCQLERNLQGAVTILRHIVADPKETLESQRKIQSLLEILESAAPQEKGAAQKIEGEQEPQVPGPEPTRADSLDLNTYPLLLIARYRPGDLGLVPRPTWKQMSGISRAVLSGKASSQKTSTSVNPAASADPEAAASTSFP